jgi:hypothetical protein
MMGWGKKCISQEIPPPLTGLVYFFLLFEIEEGYVREVFGKRGCFLFGAFAMLETGQLQATLYAITTMRKIFLEGVFVLYHYPLADSTGSYS